MINFEELSKQESFNETLSLMKKYNDKIVTGLFHQIKNTNSLISEDYYFDTDTSDIYKTLVEMDDDVNGNVYIVTMGGENESDFLTKEKFEEISYAQDHWEAPVTYYSKYTKEDFNK